MSLLVVVYKLARNVKGVARMEDDVKGAAHGALNNFPEDSDMDGGRLYL